MKIKCSVGKNIKKFRKLSGLSQCELASKLNVSNRTISSWEIDRTKPSMDDVNKMIEIFGCTMDDIVTTTIEEISDEERTILSQYRLADDATKDMIVRLLAFAKKADETEGD